MGALIEWLAEAFQKLGELLLYIPRVLWDGICETLASIIEAIPPFDWIPVDIWAGIDPGIAWFLQEMQLPLGVTIVMSALVTRFVVRRLPIVG